MHKLINPHLQRKARLYEKAKDILNLLQLLISGIYLFAFFISDLSNTVSSIVVQYPFTLAILFFILSLSIPIIIILFPLTLKKDFLVEKRFGLSNQNLKSWLIDYIKGLLLGLITGYPMLLLLFYLLINAPNYWWVFGVLGLFLYQIIIAFIFPILLLPLFFKQKPIEDETLLEEIKRLFGKTSMKLKGAYSINLSSKTKRENALLTGLWKTRRILLGDTLLEKRGKGEILAVLAHEIGHHIKRHMLKFSVLGLVTSFALFYFINRLMLLFSGFPTDFQRVLALFPILILCAGIISFPMRFLTNAYLRNKEREADEVALSLTGDKDSFIKVMAGLANSNLAVAYPKKIKVLISYTHPPIGERIDFAERF